MNRSAIVFLALTIVLFLSGCNAQPEISASSEMSDSESATSSVPDISASSEISGSEPATSSMPEITSGNLEDHKDVTYEVSDRLHKDMPKYRFVAKGMTWGTEDYARGDVMGIEAYDEKGNSILSADFSSHVGDELYGNPVYNEMMDTMGLHIVDVNFDGYKDVIILNVFAGAHSNTWYNCWLWDPKTSSFVESESFAKICNPALDPKNKCIYSSGGSGAEFWGGSIYKYIGGKFEITNNLDADGKGLTETKLVSGEMVVVRKVSYTCGDKSEEAERQYYKKSKLWQLDNPRWYMTGGHQSDQWLGG